MEQQIIELIEQYKQLIESPTDALMKNVFSLEHSCSLISITNTFIGRESIYNDFIIGRIHTLYETIELIIDHIDIFPIDMNHAYVIFGYHTKCLRKDTNEPYGIIGLETQLLTKENNQWRIIHVHYSK